MLVLVTLVSYPFCIIKIQWCLLYIPISEVNIIQDCFANEIIQ